MTQEIPKHEWKNFFDDLSKRRFEWRTKIEVLGSNIGDQILSDDLPLNGITVEEKKDKISVEVIVGFDEANHQTHTVTNPLTIIYESDPDDLGGVVQITEENGTKTMVYVIEPLPFKIAATRSRKMAKTVT